MYILFRYVWHDESSITGNSSVRIFIDKLYATVDLAEDARQKMHAPLGWLIEYAPVA